LNQIADPVLAWIIAHGGHPDIPLSLASGVHWKASLLLAARSWTTIGGFTSVARIAPGRFAAPIDDRWALTFAWDYDSNRAFALALEPWPNDEGDERID
jgi:hypothetical protein